MGETRTQIVAQLEADVAFLLPSDRHGPETLPPAQGRPDTFKGLIETGELGGLHLRGASSKQFPGSPGSAPGGIRATRPRPPRSRPGSRRAVAPRRRLGHQRRRVQRRERGHRRGHHLRPGHRSAADLDDVLAPGRRIGGIRSVSGGVAAMGGRSMGARDVRGDGVINEEDAAATTTGR
jgi:hypothetical protein